MSRCFRAASTASSSLGCCRQKLRLENFQNAWDAGINDLSASRRTPIRRVIAGRRGVTVIEGPFDDGTAEAGTIAMPSPRDTKSKSELNWLVMILWLNTTPRSLVAISSVRRNPESLGIEIMGSSMQIECGSGNTAEDVGNLSGRQSRCNRGFHQVAHTRISFHDTSRSDKLPDIMRDFLIAIVFLVGTVLFLGGELFFGHLFSTPTAAIGIGAVLCFLAAVAKDRIDRDMTLF
jgi:hypothetical protein